MNLKEIKGLERYIPYHIKKINYIQGRIEVRFNRNSMKYDVEVFVEKYT